MHRNEVTNFYYRIKCQKKKNRNLNPMSSHTPSSHLSFHLLKKQQKRKEAIILIMTVSISFIYTGVNFNTQPSKLHENYGRQSIYKQFLAALPCSPSPAQPGTATTHPQREAGAAAEEGTWH